MLIPINTDAPIYHWPWATLGLIITNIFTFALTGGGRGMATEFFVLQFGVGLHPLQWLLCNFVHFGFLHLLLNMIFLWGFGIIIEGKLGWWKYLLVYMGIGIFHSAILQISMLGQPTDSPVAGGASGVIFGLLAMAVVWAPKNEITCILLILYRGMVIDISILSFVGYFIVLQFFNILVMALLSYNVSISSEVIHIFGTFTGFVVGFLMLYCKMVDCENWDLLAVMRGTYGNQDPEEYKYKQKSKKAKAKKTTTDEMPVMFGEDVDPLDEFARAEKKITSKTKALRKIRELLEQGKATAAVAEYKRMQRIIGDARLDRQELKAMADGLYKVRDYPQAVPLMEEYIERFPEKADSMRIRLAGIFLDAQQRPRQALRLLKELPQDTLPPNLEPHRQKMVKTAKKMIQEGVIELDGNVWT